MDRPFPWVFQRAWEPWANILAYQVSKHESVSAADCSWFALNISVLPQFGYQLYNYHPLLLDVLGLDGKSGVEGFSGNKLNPCFEKDVSWYV